jgi:predicted PurR-regulated permease PerM
MDRSAVDSHNPERIETAAESATAQTEQSPSNANLRKIFAAGLTLLLAIVFVRMIAPFLVSLLLGALFSHLLYPVFIRIRKVCGNEGIAAFATTLGAVIVFAVPVTLLIGAVSREAIRLTAVAEPWVEEQTSESGVFLTIPSWLPFSEQLQPYRRGIVERAGEALGQLGDFVVQNISRATQGTLAFLLYFFVMLYAIFFFLIRGRSLLELLSEHIPLSAAEQRSIAEKGIAVTRATLKSILVIGAVQGILGGLAFAVVGIEGAIFWGLVMAFASAIPGIGVALIWVPAAVILAVRGDYALAIGLALWGAIVVSSIDNVLRPYLIGHEARMPDLLILVSTLGGIAMFGATGLIVGPALAGIFVTSLSIFLATFGTASQTERAVRLIGAHPPPEHS